MAQVNIVVDPELRDRMKRKAQRNGRSLSEEFRRAALDWLGEVEDDERDAAPGLRLAAASGGGGPRSVPGGGRSGDAGVGVDPFAVALTVDPFESDVVPAVRDARGRLLSPIVRDEWIDTA